MAKNRRADAVVFGFDFQVNAAIVLMLENITELKTLRLDGNYEDIELELNDNHYILAQAKAIVQSSTDFTHVREKLKKSLTSLSEGAAKVNAEQLIFITNSPNPLKENNSKNLFLGTAHRSFKSLPQSSQGLIKKYLEGISHPLDLNKFMIQILPFETDNEFERYKFVKQCVDDFIAELDINLPGVGRKLLTIWQNEVFENSSKKDAEIKLSKNEIIWPILVIATDIKRCDDDFADEFDSSLYDEIIYRYSKLIDSCCERFEFFTKVLYDYKDFKSEKSSREKCKEFVFSNWKNYLNELKIDSADEETQRGLIQIILYNIVKNRITIDKVKKGVNL